MRHTFVNILDLFYYNLYQLENQPDEIKEMFMWYEELEDQNVSSIIINAEEGDFFYNPNEVSIIEAPINQLKSEE